MKLSYRRLPLVLLLTGLSFLTTSCLHTQPKTPTTAVTMPSPSAACAVWPVYSYVYPGDTADTVRKIIAGNAARKAYCP